MKGSHIIVPKFWHGEHAYLVQNHDKRVIFINPYEGDKALIGTTDIPYEGRAEEVTASEESEIAYLLAAVNRYFKEKLPARRRARDLLGRPAALRRRQGQPLGGDARLRLRRRRRRAAPPLLNVFGGKITTFRELAERGLEKLRGTSSPRWAPPGPRDAPLPGGEMPGRRLRAVHRGVPRRPPLDAARRSPHHYARLYGARADARRRGRDLARRARPPLRRASSTRPRRATSTPTNGRGRREDVLWRRTKQGLHMTPEQRRAFDDWFAAYVADPRTGRARRATLRRAACSGRSEPHPLDLSTNPLVNRFAEPADLVETVARDIRVRDLQLTHEFINPSWPAAVIRRLTREMGRALARTGVRVTSGMTGPYGRLNHFGHPDRDVRRYYVDWFKTFADIVGDLGGHVGRHPVRDPRPTGTTTTPPGARR